MEKRAKSTDALVEVKIAFELSEVGQKNELLKGNSPRRKQVISTSIPAKDLGLFGIDDKGILFIDKPSRFDLPPTAEELVAAAREAVIRRRGAEILRNYLSGEELNAEDSKWLSSWLNSEK
ncbi:MAG TPA: hypothetical protein VMV15_07515 [Candidatus Binataceae bacterium]|nr:hypothetical protein [Candidatus Binataceae bacterium]